MIAENRHFNNANSPRVARRLEVVYLTTKNRELSLSVFRNSITYHLQAKPTSFPAYHLPYHPLEAYLLSFQEYR